MSRLIRNNRNFLFLFSSTTIPQRKALVNCITRQQLKAISEIVHNVIKGTIPVTHSDKLKLEKHQKASLILGREKYIRRDKVLVLKRKSNVIVKPLDTVISLLWKNDSRSVRKISKYKNVVTNSATQTTENTHRSLVEDLQD